MHAFHNGNKVHFPPASPDWFSATHKFLAQIDQTQMDWRVLLIGSDMSGSDANGSTGNGSIGNGSIAIGSIGNTSTINGSIANDSDATKTQLNTHHNGYPHPFNFKNNIVFRIYKVLTEVRRITLSSHNKIFADRIQ